MNSGMVVFLWLVTVFSLLAVLFLRRRRGDRFQAGNVLLHYRDEGWGEPVVLLHGLAVNSDLNWRLTGMLAYLRRHFRVITLDLRGHGLSDRPRDPAAYGQELAHDVCRLLDHLGLPRAHIVGYSLGGFIALKAAACHSDRLCSLILLAAGWERPDDQALFRGLDRCADDLCAGRGIRALAVERFQPGRFHRALLWCYTRLMTDRQALGALVRSLRRLTVSEGTLRELKVPVCVIAGEADYLRPAAERLRDRLPGVEFYLYPGAGHISLAWRRSMWQRVERFLLQHRCPL